MQNIFLICSTSRWQSGFKNDEICIFEVNFLSKNDLDVSIFFSLNNFKLGAHLLLLTFVMISILKMLCFLEWCPLFDNPFGLPKAAKQRPRLLQNSLNLIWILPVKEIFFSNLSGLFRKPELDENKPKTPKVGNDGSRL